MKSWCINRDTNLIDWLRISGLSPVPFPEAPMNRLIGSNQRCMGLLNRLIQCKLNTMSPEDEGKGEQHALQRTPLVIMFSGKTGMGKTTTAEAIAELHRRPLVKFRLAKFGAVRSAYRLEFVSLLELATAWNAFVLVDDAQIMFGQKSNGSILTRCEMAHDFASMIRQFPGIVIMSRRWEESLIDEMSCQIQLEIKFEQFSKEKRFKIWKALFSGRTQQGPPDGVVLSAGVDDDLLHGISEWELNGHEIQHLFNNILLLWDDLDEKGLTLSDIDELRAMTWSPSKQMAAVKAGSLADGNTQGLDDGEQD